MELILSFLSVLLFYLFLCGLFFCLEISTNGTKTTVICHKNCAVIVHKKKRGKEHVDIWFVFSNKRVRLHGKTETIRRHTGKDLLCIARCYVDNDRKNVRELQNVRELREELLDSHWFF